MAARGKRRNVDEYFNGHGVFRGRIGTLVVGLSIAASFFSGISFIVYSSFAYAHGLQIVAAITMLPVSWIVLRRWFLRRYLAAGNRRPYDIVEARFGYPVRVCLSIMFVLLRIGWMAVIIYAPALIILGALGLGNQAFWPVVLAIGCLCTLISSIGGLRGVIVTDAIQFLIIASGLILTIGLILLRLHLTPSVALADLRQGGHLQLFDFSLSLTAPWTIWAIVCGAIINSLGLYMADQMSLQRYLASESPAAVFGSFAINVAGAIGVIVLLVTVGSLLFLWYRHHPDPGLPADADQVLPYFATHQLPVGMAGLLVAAIVAATMNTLTSGINSLAGSLVNDFALRLGRPRTPAELFRLGRVLSVGVGAISTAAAGFASRLGTILQATNIVMGAFLGPMLACMMLAAGTARVRPRVLLVGMLLGAAAGAAVALTPASSFWVGPAGFLVALLVPVLDPRRAS